jgi:thymidylate synthase
MSKHSQNANVAWLKLVNTLLKEGTVQSPRGRETLEILGHQTVVDMKYPLLSIYDRNLGYKFLCAEAHWILTGDNRVKTIEPYSKAIKFFSDDGEIFFGAYGPSIIEQFSHCRAALLKDRHTRQAVLTTWKRNPPESKDIPCTLTTQFIIRSNWLHVVHTMRSSDVWLGWPYDIFNFTMLAACMLLDLKNTKPEEFGTLALGNLFFTAGSQHLYEVNKTDAHNCWYRKTAFKYNPFNPHEFPDSSALVNHLGLLKDKKEVKYNAFRELLEL